MEIDSNIEPKELHNKEEQKKIHIIELKKIQNLTKEIMIQALKGKYKIDNSKSDEISIYGSFKQASAKDFQREISILDTCNKIEKIEPNKVIEIKDSSSEKEESSYTIEIEDDSEAIEIEDDSESMEIEDSNCKIPINTVFTLKSSIIDLFEPKITNVNLDCNILKNTNYFYPWISNGSQVFNTHGYTRLHYEIYDFYNFIKLNHREKINRKKTFEILNEIISKNFNGLYCKLYGSFPLQISIPISDIDIVILRKKEINHNSNINNYKIAIDFLEELYNVLQKTNQFRNLILIKSKACPIIKCCYLKKNISIDINPFKKNTLYTLNQIKDILNTHQEIKPLLLLFKYILFKRKLNSTYTGGISSYILFSLLYFYIFYFKKQKTYDINETNEQKTTLAIILKGFLYFFGYFEYNKYKISFIKGCCLIKRTDNNNHLLSMENMFNVKEDLGIKCYRYSQIIKTFQDLYKSLENNNSEEISLLNHIINDDDFLRIRAVRIAKANNSLNRINKIINL